MNYTFIDGADQIDPEEVQRLLKTTYWAANRSLETIKASMRHSSCHGVFPEGENRLIGFARVITDYATTYYLCDVIIDPAYRHQGLGKALVSHVVSQFATLRGLLLTRDAHGLYAHFGFERADGRAMVKAPDRS